MVTQEWEDRIEYILDNFDFENIHKVMTFLDWKYDDIGAVPDVDCLKKTATNLLEHCITTQTDYCSSGGFVAEIKNEVVLTLFFRVEQSATVIVR